ncbi:MAG: hypothetical protein N3F10_05305 [Candidatus Bathyarchaeota archaeon]|nr:hypothetical protein [Candidatus Bathyarchaeota archaeon]MCX8177694.1 hypothetical protein [Candidatus Bathyarchaeota archaeon]MDW8193954.1 hypothetical protein [Nitrososphaerota archaeon]
MSEECCRNPVKPECNNTDIALSIRIRNKLFPICRACWQEIADKDIEWGEWGFQISSVEAKGKQTTMGNNF